MTGRVVLIGAGPGDPGLITVRGLEVLKAADVVLHDRLVAPALLEVVRADAIVVDVGKVPGGPRDAQARIHRLLVHHATAGRLVARLKGGDPFVFGRGTEEMAACRAAEVPCEVVPGVTSAIAVPALAGIAVTERGRARSFAVITGETDGESDGRSPVSLKLARALKSIDTVVVLMGRRNLGTIAEAMVKAGRSDATPVACIQMGSTPEQAIARGTLSNIAERVEAAGLDSPIVTVVGSMAEA